MRVVIQRVSCASVQVNNTTVGAIGEGLVIFVGVGKGDTADDAASLAGRVANLRIFADAEGKSNLSLLDTGGSALVISQFTLYADCHRGRRPSFAGAADAELAEKLVDEFHLTLERLGVPAACGCFGAHMLVSLVNDGPYTIVLDTSSALQNVSS